MKKIPTLFKREFYNHKVIDVLPEVTPGCEWVLNGEGVATEKIDGSCCAIINGVFYKRYDAKKGKKPPEGAIPCQEAPDPVTGHFPHWVKVDFNDPADKWFVNAFNNTPIRGLHNGTCEAIGVHFQGNHYGLSDDILEPHGAKILKDVPRDFDSIRHYLQCNYIEGIVFHRGNGEMCKIKRFDFGFPWNEVRK